MMEATWFYRHSILFICAIVTTVGYGNIIPMTEAGKVTATIMGLGEGTYGRYAYAPDVGLRIM